MYQRLVEQLRSLILRGELEADFGLPPIRAAATELRVSIITVKKAWEELEREGLIYTVVGRGCFVTPFTDEERGEKRRNVVLTRLTLDLEFYRDLGVGLEELTALVREVYGKSR